MHVNKCLSVSSTIVRDVNGNIKNSLKMPGPGGVKGQRPCGGPKGATPPGRN